MKKYRMLLLTAAAIIAINGCSDRTSLRKALDSITVADLARQVEMLGGDNFMGRAPFTEGEEITKKWLSSELERIGFEPAFGESWFQDVPMTEIVSEVAGPVRLRKNNTTLTLQAPDDIALTSPLRRTEINVSASELIFAGFGIVAPEYDWDDYRNLDVSGKIVIVLINDPGLYTNNTSLFKGREMTYYGRWTYKYEEAARQGARGILIIHETEGAGYEYTIPRKSSLKPNLFIDYNSPDENKCAITGWLSAPAAEKLFSLTGKSVNELRQEACNRGYSGFNTGTVIDVTIHNTMKKSVSSNVAGVLKGRKRPGEVIIYSAHWDHFGIGEAENGDSIYNGAVDNGTSIAWAMEIGEAFAALPVRPERSIMLFFPTAEESNLLGSRYYNANPVFDPENTVACFNNDLLLPIGRMKDVMVTGYGQSDLDSIVAIVAGRYDRYIMPDPNAHTGMYFRSDHFPFAAAGIPAMYSRGNCDSREYGREWAAEQELDYLVNRYHRPADNYNPSTWNFEGIREDAQLLFETGYILANSSYFPRWSKNSEFGNIRERDKRP